VKRYTTNAFNRDFRDDDAFLDYTPRLLYTDGVMCLKCGQIRKHHRLNGRKAYSCDHCGTHVYPLAGTIFEKSCKDFNKTPVVGMVQRVSTVAVLVTKKSLHSRVQVSADAKSEARSRAVQ